MLKVLSTVAILMMASGASAADILVQGGTATVDGKEGLPDGGVLIRDDATVILNGGITFLKGASAVFKVKRFEMRNGAILVTGKSDLTIDADTFVAEDAQILGFYDVLAQAHVGADAKSPPATKGGRGDAGLDAGTVVVIAGELQLGASGAPLKVDLNGQQGGDGGRGAPGDRGRKGPDGDDALSGWTTDFDNNYVETCVSQATSGGRGFQGQQGGPGGDPGVGGNGGSATFTFTKMPTGAVDAKAMGGVGGRGGGGGEGGPGGPGGDPGRDQGVCSSNVSAGPVGPKGIEGNDLKGITGASGHDGRTVVSAP